jgi:transcriptional regulator with XRE-family HTH domain
MTIRQVLAANLRKQQRGAGLSQEDLAAQADIDRTYVSALERSVYAASIDVLERIAKVLGIEESKLLKRPGRSRREPRPRHLALTTLTKRNVAPIL